MHCWVIKGPSINVCMCDLIPQKDKIRMNFLVTNWATWACVWLCAMVCLDYGLVHGGELSFYHTNTHIYISKPWEESRARQQSSDLMLQVPLCLCFTLSNTNQGHSFSRSLSSSWFIGLLLLSQVNIALTWCLACTLILSITTFLSLQASPDTPTHSPPPCLCYWCVCVCGAH